MSRRWVASPCPAIPSPKSTARGSRITLRCHGTDHTTKEAVVRFPLVLMLEPLHACNLTCTGCGRIREYSQSIKEKLSVTECLAAVDECGAPIVSICGGEPLIYPEIGPLARGILKRRKNLYLCTNGMFIQKRLHE